MNMSGKILRTESIERARKEMDKTVVLPMRREVPAFLRANAQSKPNIQALN
jgi:hypothetical protein